MKITVYELLGLIKDRKAPYKFIINDEEYRWDYEDNKYYRKASLDEHDQKYYEVFEDDYNLYFCLNEEVEITEAKDIKQIHKSYPIFDFNEKSFFAMKEMLQDMYDKQVEIIDELNKVRKENK